VSFAKVKQTNRIAFCKMSSRSFDCQPLASAVRNVALILAAVSFYTQALAETSPPQGIGGFEAPDGARKRERRAPENAAQAPEMTVKEAILQLKREPGDKILWARRLQTRRGVAFRIKVLTRAGGVRVVQIAQPHANGKLE
jgi:hypothetical protein